MASFSFFALSIDQPAVLGFAGALFALALKNGSKAQRRRVLFQLLLFASGPIF